VSGRSERTRALVLRSVDYRDADRIVTLLTERFGKVSVLARSARASRRRFGGSLEPCALIEAEVRLGRAEVGSIARASVTRAYPRLLAELSRLTMAGAALELVREAVPVREPDARMFAVALEMLEVLDAEAAPAAELLLAFQARVLALAGLAPGVDVCARCGKRAAEGRAAYFDPELGGIVCRACGGGPLRLGGEARALVASWLGASWRGAAAAEARAAGEARTVLAAVLQHHLGRPLAGPAIVRATAALTRR
jgi:DNA repair protein RecO (recombination protein O)